MTDQDNLGEIITSDVLVIGGGIAGLVAAIKAKETAPEADVLIVDKATVGWAGSASKTGGMLTHVSTRDDPVKFADFSQEYVADGLCDRTELFSYIQDTDGAVRQLQNWGLKFARDSAGNVAVLPHIWAPYCSMSLCDIDMMLTLRTVANSLGVRILNKVQIAELILDNGVAGGAVGFGLIDGRYYILRAKATVLSVGRSSRRAKKKWEGGDEWMGAASSGECVAAAYRAGAELWNAEFCVNAGFRRPGKGRGANQNFLFNSAGENIAAKYLSESERKFASNIRIVLAIDKEVRESKGPVVIKMPVNAGPMKPPIPPEIAQNGRPRFNSMQKRTAEKQNKAVPPGPPGGEIELYGECGGAVIKVGHDMKTSLPGLWAIGDAAGGQSPGLLSSARNYIPGTGLVNATVSGLRSGVSAANSIADTRLPQINHAELKRLKKDIFAPLLKDIGFEPETVTIAVSEITSSPDSYMRRNKKSLENALSKLEGIKQQVPVSDLQAKDPHGLAKCLEVRHKSLFAEMSLKAALLRTESRGSHFREDFPQRDDANWLKRIVIKAEDGKMVLLTEGLSQ